MKTDDRTYVRVKDIAGQNLLCPINEIKIPPSEPTEIADICVEEDVVGRYAGDIHVKQS